MFVIIWWLVLPTKCLLLTHFTVYSTSFTDTHSELIYIQCVLLFMPLCIFFGFCFFLFRCFFHSPVILLFLKNIRFDTVTKLSKKKETKMMIKRKTWASLYTTKKSIIKMHSRREREGERVSEYSVWCEWGVTCSWRPKVSVNYERRGWNHRKNKINLRRRRRRWWRTKKRRNKPERALKASEPVGNM